jgi:hypothetical protein
MTSNPCPIEPGNIRLNDRVRLTHTGNASGVIETYQFTVARVGDGYVIARQESGALGAEFAFDWGTWELVSREVPRTGSTWRHPNRVEYVVTDRGLYKPYNYSHQYLESLNPKSDSDWAYIKDLELIFEGPEEGL